MVYTLKMSSKLLGHLKLFKRKENIELISTAESLLFAASRGQLTAEKIVTRYRKGFQRREWIKTRARNEALDCRVYALSAYAILNININSVANRFEKQKDSEAKPKPTTLNPVVHRPTNRTNKGNWATDWRNY